MHVCVVVQGTRQLPSGECEACPPGHSSAVNSTFCYLCGAGTYAASGDAACTPCPEGSYSSFNGSSACVVCGSNEWSSEGAFECEECPAEGVTCVKGIRVFLTGFWRSESDWNVSVVTKATVFHACGSGACNTSENGDASCAPLHTGPLCAQCVEGYATTPSGGCTPCPAPRLSKLMASLVIISIMSGLAGLIAKAARNVSKKSRPVLLFKIFINYIQASVLLL